MSLSKTLASTYDQETVATRKLLEALPEDQFAWKPHAKSMSLAELAGHIAETPSWAGSMLEDEFDFADMGDYKPFVPEKRADLLAKLDQGLAGFHKALGDRDDAFMQATWTGKKGSEVMMSMPRHQALRSFIIHHTIHHRGQLSVYLRLLGVPVPPTFGPTADFPSF